MPEEEMLEEETDDTEEEDKPKGSALPLIIALLAFVAAVAAIVMNVVMAPDTDALETRISAVEQSVQTNSNDVAALKEAQSNMDETVGAMIDEKMAEQAAMEETEGAMEEGGAMMEESAE